MKTIVAFGDSNTWGCDPATGRRLAPDARWTGVMRKALGAGYAVIEEGLNGRTTVYDDPIEPGRCGLDYLPPCLLSHAPLDLVIISLGCNDMKRRFSATPGDIAGGAERLIEAALLSRSGPEGKWPKVLLVAPPPTAKLTGFAEMFDGAEEKSRKLGARYAALAKAMEIAFLDAGAVIHCSDLDGIHYEADQHKRLGKAMAEAARAALGDKGEKKVKTP